MVFGGAGGDLNPQSTICVAVVSLQFCRILTVNQKCVSLLCRYAVFLSVGAVIVGDFIIVPEYTGLCFFCHYLFISVL